MTVKFTVDIEPLTHFVTGCRDNYLILGACLASGQNHCHQVAYSHQVVCGAFAGQDFLVPLSCLFPAARAVCYTSKKP